MATGPHDGDEDPTERHVPSDESAPTEALVSSTVGDRCVSCGAPLSSDQRYCVVCGERRGQPRFALPAAARTAEQPAVVPVPRRESRRPRVSSGATLVAGVGTLLLAMGVGVLIGHTTSSNAKTVAAAPQVITVNGGGGSTSGSSSGSAGASSQTATTASKSKSSAKSHHRAKPTKKASAAVNKQAAAKQAAAASKVLGSSAKNVPPPTVTVGSKGQGAGYSKKTGKFNGSFFGQ